MEINNFLGAIHNRTASKHAFWTRVAAALPNTDTDLELCQRRSQPLLPFPPPDWLTLRLCAAS